MEKEVWKIIFHKCLAYIYLIALISWYMIIFRYTWTANDYNFWLYLDR